MIVPKKGILLIKKHSNTQLSADIVIEENEEDKNLITGEVLAGESEFYPQGTSVIFGKYSLFTLLLQGEKYYFLEEENVLGTTNYKEDV